MKLGYIFKVSLIATALLPISIEAQNLTTRQQEIVSKLSEAELSFHNKYLLPILEANGVVCVKIGASWCPPCQRMVPIINELKTELHGKVTFFELPIDDLRTPQNIPSLLLKAFFGVTISSIPTLLFFKDGKLLETHVGSMNKETLSLKVSSYL